MWSLVRAMSNVRPDPEKARSQPHVMREATAKAATAIQPAIAAAYMLKVIRAPRAEKALTPSPWYPD